MLVFWSCVNTNDCHLTLNCTGQLFAILTYPGIDFYTQKSNHPQNIHTHTLTKYSCIWLCNKAFLDIRPIESVYVLFANHLNFIARMYFKKIPQIHTILFKDIHTHRHALYTDTNTWKRNYNLLNMCGWRNNKNIICKKRRA